MTPQEKKKAKLNLSILAVSGLIVVLVLIAGAFSDSPEPQEKKEPVAVVHNDVLDASVRQVKQFGDYIRHYPISCNHVYFFLYFVKFN